MQSNPVQPYIFPMRFDALRVVKFSHILPAQLRQTIQPNMGELSQKTSPHFSAPSSTYRCHTGVSPHFLNSFPWRVARRQQASSSDCPCQFVGDPIHDLGGVGAQPRRLRLGNGRPSGNGLSIPQKMLISLGCRAFATRLLTPTLDKRWHKSNAKDKTQLTSVSPVFGSRSPSNT